ncbi:hypothetical protein QFZ30_002862 [Arthrobacter pascens]|uniref:DUF5719 family protein n=1 Tax=Arthrobacter pascens TaxID=1677 RepID=UPI002791833A|nr:DUF5719 family protein [Arthrobacter pascens]MDQ0679480.1 hypothetical protein [Arthrobacter pascens]
MHKDTARADSTDEAPTDEVSIDAAPAGGAQAQHRPVTGKAPHTGVFAGILSAALILAAAGGVVTAASVSPQPQGSRSFPAALAAVPAGSSVGVCPGPARLLEGTVAGTDPQFSPESETAASAVTGAVLSTAGGVLPGSRLSALDGTTAVEIAKDSGQPSAAAGPQELLAGVVAGHAVDGVSVLSADAVANQKASAAALMKYTATDGDLQGSAAANCQQPANDMWLAGASTTLGRTSVLVLSNASSTPATVSLELYGSKGQIQAPGSRGLLVAPGTTRSVVLAGLAPGEARLSVHLRSAGGPVAAAIQQSVLRGLTPGGVDFIAPGTGPATRQVTTGVDIQDAGGIAALTAERGFEDAGPALQLTVPGASDAVVEIKLFGRDGQQALPGGGVVTAKAGAVTEVSLAGVPAGQYTVSTSSDVSFVAASRVTRGLKNDQASDVAWSASGGRLGSQHVVPVPQGGGRVLVFGALEDRATISYSAITADGRIHGAASADIAGGTTTSIEVPEKVEESVVVGYVVSASGSAAYGALLIQQGGREDISTLAFTPAASGQEKVPVTLGY